MTPTWLLLAWLGGIFCAFVGVELCIERAALLAYKRWRK